MPRHHIGLVIIWSAARGSITLVVNGHNNNVNGEQSARLPPPLTARWSLNTVAGLARSYQGHVGRHCRYVTVWLNNTRCRRSVNAVIRLAIKRCVASIGQQGVNHEEIGVGQ